MYLEVIDVIHIYIYTYAKLISVYKYTHAVLYTVYYICTYYLSMKIIFNSDSKVFITCPDPFHCNCLQEQSALVAESSYGKI